MIPIVVLLMVIFITSYGRAEEVEKNALMKRDLKALNENFCQLYKEVVLESELYVNGDSALKEKLHSEILSFRERLEDYQSKTNYFENLEYLFLKELPEVLKKNVLKGHFKDRITLEEKKRHEMKLAKE